MLEKECIFRRLINDNFVERQYNGKALLETVCGFPDVQTRMLLNRLSSKYPTLPIYGIADFDPYGVEIMATYTMGSKSRAHERDVLACPSLRWLGIHSSDIEAYQVPPSLKIPMTERDNSRVRKMLEREVLRERGRRGQRGSALCSGVGAGMFPRKRSGRERERQRSRNSSACRFRTSTL